MQNRSLPVTYLQVLVPAEGQEAFADEICRRDVMMFTDLNSDVQLFSRERIKEITKIHDTERAMKGIKEHFIEQGLLDELDFELAPENMERARDPNLILYTLTDEIQAFYRDLMLQITNLQALQQQLNNHQDNLKVLECLDVFLEDAPAMKKQAGVEGYQSLEDNVGFKYLAGVCPVNKLSALRRQIFHVTRGNRYFRSETFEEASADGERKAAFVVFFIGDYVRKMITKFSEWMGVQIFLDSSEGFDKENVVSEVGNKIRNHEDLLRITLNELHTMMNTRKADVCRWNIQLKQELAIRVLVNKFKTQENSNLVRVEGWVPTNRTKEVEDCLMLASTGKGIMTPIAGKGIIPTYFETNKVTYAFQLMIDTYGVPRYGEFNPAVPSMVTFPFLFAMMFGDFFHGGFLFLIGCYLIMNERNGEQSRNEFGQFLHMARYVIFAMGFFAVYNGLIYNDATSIAPNIFGTTWSMLSIKVKDHASGNMVVKHVDNGLTTGVYPFGVDPVWNISKNQLGYMNSLKMKLSVIVGILQMVFGVCLKGSNFVHNGEYYKFCFDFLPQLVWMIGFFVYMQFIIIYKWCVDWSISTQQPPSLISTLVDFVLAPGSVSPQNQLYEGQATVQVVLLLCMVVSVPLMLFGTPCIYWRLSKREDIKADDDEEQEAPAAHGHGHGDGPYDITQELIFQGIHTIEFLLGSISNTASYLRLWALSLAHAELAEVFYGKLIIMAVPMGPIVMFCCVSGFFGVTIAVLMIMDVLECLLHALRLHWVEFQNKFYYADGEPLITFCYKNFAEGKMS